MALADNKVKIQALLAGINALPDEKPDPVLQEKNVTPATSAQTVRPDTGYDGLSQVTVDAMPTAEQATPTINVDVNGKITSSATQTAGYVSAGTKSADPVQLTTQGGKTITPTENSQTAVAKNVYTTGEVTVGAISKTYIGSNVTRKGAQTYTPGTSNQTIASGQYLSGTQTIEGSANLKAENIKSGVEIFDVLGTFEGGGGLPEGFSAFEVFDWTPSEDMELSTSGPSINHSLGVVPDGFYITTTEQLTDFSLYSVVAYAFDVAWYKNSTYASMGRSQGSDGNALITYTGFSKSAYVTSSAIKILSSALKSYLRAGVTYQIIVYKR